MDLTIEWRLLRPETVLSENGSIHLNSRPRAVLLRLLMEPNRRVSWETVASFLWGDDPPKTQRNSVARFVADLRRALGDHGNRIVTEAGGYRVVVHEGELDFDAALAAVADSRHLADVDPERSHERAVVALELVGSGPNPWLKDQPGADAALRRNEELRIAALAQIADSKLKTARHHELVPLLERGIEDHPFHENLWAGLIVALHRSARTAEALRACQRLRSELAEIGLEPSEPVRRLEDQILTETLPAGQSAATSGPGVPTGRDADLDAIEAAIAVNRLVSIVGLSGTGKSTLAEAASRDEALNGVTVHKVDLRSVRDATRVISQIGSAVGIPASVPLGTADELAKHLLRVSCLIVIDNCEHLRQACAGVAQALISQTQGVRVLATGREPLRAEAEHVYRLGMLPTLRAPGASSPSQAASVFIEYAQAHLSPTELEAGLLPDVESICGTLLGHLLAMRLAAGLLAELNLKELQAALESAPDISASNAPVVVLDVAWSRLDHSQQAVLARLSVFAGGFTLAAADSVCSERDSVRPQIEALTKRGLVHSGIDGRFTLDAPVCDFAAGRLSDRRETVVVLDRLTGWLRQLTEQWGIAELSTIAEASERLLPEQANLIEALTHLRDQGRAEELAWLAVRSGGMWIGHGMYTEVIRWLSPIADDESVSDAARSAAEGVLVEADLTIGDFSQFSTRGMKCITLARGDPYDWIPGVAGFMALVSLTVAMEMSTDEFLDLAGDVAEQTTSRHVNRAHALMRRAHVAHHTRQYDTAVAYFRRALAIIDEPGRQLLALEMGETISLYLAGRRDEALESVGRWKSRPETDEWHYQVDIVGAIIRGGCDDPEQATADLAAALRRHTPTTVWARADEFQLAFGLLAGMRGEDKLSEELFASSKSGSPFLTSMVMDHIARTRGLDRAGRDQMEREFWVRTIPLHGYRDLLMTEDELFEWWETGSAASTPTP